ncbi:MAG: PAS domain-containing protein [Spirochaetales bacterium]|nr:PAS domain-containing protein [Spirochaetales bacterium]
MSSIISKDNPLIDFLEGLYNGTRSRKHYDKYSRSIDNADPWNVNLAIDILISRHEDFDRIEQAVARFIRACAKGLDKQTPLVIREDHFLGILQKENRRITEYRGKLSSLFKELALSQKDSSPGQMDEMLKQLNKISDITAHYRKIEYPLFSAMEECLEEYNCSKLMWHIHDQIINGLKLLIGRLENEKNPLDKDFNSVFGEVYLKLAAITYREEKILFPILYRAVPEERFEKMLGELEEFGSSFDVILPQIKTEMSTVRSDGIPLSVGRLLPGQINLMLKSLPLDITFVDENDKVCYYSQGKERIFPRSPGIIGRNVKNCHPPASVHIVEKIVDDLKSRRRDSAEFWIQMDGNFVHIRYFPLFENETYKGVIEVSQNIAPLRVLKGERRLLDD